MTHTSNSGVCVRASVRVCAMMACVHWIKINDRARAQELFRAQQPTRMGFNCWRTPSEFRRIITSGFKPPCNQL